MVQFSSHSPLGEDSIIADLLEALELDPSSVEARKVLIDQYISLEWNEAVVILALEILALRPNDQDALAILQTYDDQSPEPKSSATAAAWPSFSSEPSAATKNDSPVVSTDVRQLKEQYEALHQEAETLFRELVEFQKIAPKLDCLEELADLDALLNRKVSTVARRKVDKDTFDLSAAMLTLTSRSLSKDTKTTSEIPSLGSRTTKRLGKKGKKSTAPAINAAPQSAKALAQAMKAVPQNALATALSDFEGLIRWQKTTGSATDDDTVRSILRRRVDAVKPHLLKTLSHIPATAFMHAEHEYLKKTYVNAETMIGGDPISSIARDNFWVSEDNYAWDMEELVAAIKATNGSLRNPLSREPFSATDIEAIVRHPLGSSIAAVQIAQAKLKKGVRPETITRLKSMATILLDDNSENSFPSHQAVDDFLSYVATLPESERETIDKLKVPAVDSHTKQPFDDTIGDAVRDAKGNRICFHKAGDLLKQAAEHLSRS